MASAFDAAATPAFSNAGVTSLTANMTVGAGSNRYAIAGVLSGAGTPLQPSAVKWGGSGGVAMTQLGTTINIGANVKLSMWGIVAPASGASTIYVSWASAQDETALVGACYTGVDQSTPTRTVAQTTGSNATPSVAATSVSGDIVVDVPGFLDGNGLALTLTVGAGQTSHGEVEGANLTFEGLGTSEETATTTTTTMSWTISNTPVNGWGILAAALIPSTGGGGGGGGGTFDNELQLFASRRNRPGRGPYSLGRYFRPRADAFTRTAQVINDSITETGSASDSPSGLLVTAGALSESGTATDSVSAVLVTTGAVAESGSASDAVSSQFVALVALSESGTGTDAVSSIATLLAALSESGTAGDLLDGANGSTTYSVSVTESGSVSDAVSSLLIALAAVSESGSAADSPSSTAVRVATLSESGSATDAMNGANGATTYDVAVTESGTATDAHSAIATLLAAIAESGAATDLVSSTWTGTRSLAEVATAIDSIFIDNGQPVVGTRIVVVQLQPRTIRVH